MKTFFRNKIYVFSLLLLFTLVLLVTTRPLWNEIFISKENISNTLVEQVPLGEITNETEIKQTINLHHFMRNQPIDINILLATYNRVNNGLIEVSLAQNDKIEKIIVNTKNLNDNSFKKFTFNKGKIFEEGPATIILKGIEASQGNAITAWQTKDASLGILTINGQKIENYNLNIDMKLPKKDTSFTFISLFIIILILILFFRLNYKVEIFNYFFFLSFFISISILCFRFPSLSTSAELYAETATNFFHNAYYSSVIHNLKQLDAGYLPLFQRVISLVIVKLFHINESFNYVIQLLSVFGIAFFASFINSRMFKNIIPSDKIRFIFSCIVGCGFLFDYELVTFINFSYLGIIVCLLVVFIDFTKISNLRYVFISILVFLLLSSKPYFIIFLPVYISLLIYYCYIRSKKHIFFYTISVISLCIQATTMIRNKMTWASTDTQVQVSFFEKIYDMFNTTIYLYFQSYLWVLYKLNPFSSKSLFYLVAMFTLMLIIVTVILLYKRIENKNAKNAILLTNYLALSSLALNAFTLPSFKNMNLWDTELLIANFRHYFVSNIMIFIGLFILSISAIHSKKTKVIVSLYLAIIIMIFGVSQDPYKNAQDSYSQWNVYNKLLNNEEYCIPVNPYPWAMCKNLNVLNSPLETSVPVSQINLLDMIPESVNWKVKSFTIETMTQQDVRIVAFDSRDNLIVDIVQLTPTGNKYSYYLLDEKTSISKIVFYNLNNNPIFIKPKVIFMGT
ncbi:hypothetical protein [Paenibacillus sp. sgz302251]|uniref:hypothetical protein n=1 Tax=Paenibacillus sp. sgz302251 TaxID=3414493 RepID=UPI003C79D649